MINDSPLGLPIAKIKTSLTFSSLLDPEPSVNKRLENAVLNPALNTLIIEPWSACANAINMPLSLLSDNTRVPKLASRPVAPTKFMTGDWWAQGLTSGLGSAIVLSGTKLLVSQCCRVSRIPISPSLSLVLGGAAYDGLRDLRQDETRLGNVLAGASMLSVFEICNPLLKPKAGFRLHAGRFAVGMAGTVAHDLVTGIANGKLSTDKIQEKLLSGGIMNVALPLFVRPLESSKTESAKPNVEKNSTYASGLEVQSKVSSDQTGPKPQSPVCEAVRVGIRSSERISDFSDYLRTHTENTVALFYDWNQKDHGVVIRYPRWPTSEFPRLSLEEIAKLAAEVPSARDLRRITVMDTPHYMEGWYQAQTNNPKFKIHGEILPSGIMLYMPESAIDVRRTLQHEYAHRLLDNSPIQSRLFAEVSSKLPPLILPDKTCRNLTGAGEAWAHLGEVLLAGPQPLSYVTAVSNPVQSVIFASALSGSLKANPLARNGTKFQDHVALIKFIRSTIRPLAVQSLKEQGHGNLAEALMKQPL